jgi:hypothetical protein
VAHHRRFAGAEEALQPDTQLGLAMLILEDEAAMTGHFNKRCPAMVLRIMGSG